MPQLRGKFERQRAVGKFNQVAAYLRVNEASVGVNGIGHLLPARDLLGIPDSRSMLPFGSRY